MSSRPAKRPRRIATAALPGKTGEAARESGCLPVVLITGFLGAGKTTLVNQVLKSRKGLRAAVFVNEYGSTDVDGELMRRQGQIERQRVLTLRDGCMCCGGNNDLRAALAEEFGSAKARDELDVLVIETSGVTDPKPVLATLASTPGVYTDSVVCVFDATTASEPNFGASADAQRQLACADLLVLSKVDLLTGGAQAADDAERDLLAAHRRAVSNFAGTGIQRQPSVIRATQGQGVQLVDLCRLHTLVGGDAKEEENGSGAAEKTGSTHEVFATHTYIVGRPLDRSRFEEWARKPPPGVLRAKGFLWVHGEPHCMVWHMAGGRGSGLHAVKEGDAPLGCEFVFIGRYGDGWSPMDIDKDLEACLVSRSA